MDAAEIEHLVTQRRLAPAKAEDSYVLPSDLVKLGQNRLGSSLVAKVFSSRSVNRDTFKTQMPRILQATKHIDIEVVGENLFLLDFRSLADRRRALCEGPWNFFKDLIVFKEPKGLEKPSEIVFADINRWVQLHNLPLAFMHPDIIRNIGEKIGRVIEVETDDGGQCTGKFVRIRVMRALQQPLQKGLWIETEDGSEKICIVLLYEKLPNFCFGCGRIGHVIKDCHEDIDPNKKTEFGTWLKANSLPAGKKSSSNRANDNSEKNSSSSEATSKPYNTSYETGNVNEVRLPFPCSEQILIHKDLEKQDMHQLPILGENAFEPQRVLPFSANQTSSEGSHMLMDTENTNGKGLMINTKEKLSKLKWKRLAREKSVITKSQQTLSGQKHSLEIKIQRMKKNLASRSRNLQYPNQ